MSRTITIGFFSNKDKNTRNYQYILDELYVIIICYLYYVREAVQHNMHIIIQLMKNIYNKDKYALFYIDNIMLSCTHVVNHVTYLVTINKLYDATVTCLA